jgi:hypothetical protein
MLKAIEIYRDCTLKNTKLAICEISRIQAIDPHEDTLLKATKYDVQIKALIRTHDPSIRAP